MELAGKDVDNVPERAGADISPNRKPITVVLIILGFLLCGMAGYFVWQFIRLSPGKQVSGWFFRPEEITLHAHL